MPSLAPGHLGGHIKSGVLLSSAHGAPLLLPNGGRGQDLASETSHKSYRPFTILSFRLQRAVGQFFLGGEQGPLPLPAMGPAEPARKALRVFLEGSHAPACIGF